MILRNVPWVGTLKFNYVKAPTLPHPPRTGGVGLTIDRRITSNDSSVKIEVLAVLVNTLITHRTYQGHGDSSGCSLNRFVATDQLL